jgi:hypothetical protein
VRAARAPGPLQRTGKAEPGSEKSPLGSIPACRFALLTLN